MCICETTIPTSSCSNLPHPLRLTGREKERERDNLADMPLECASRLHRPDGSPGTFLCLPYAITITPVRPGLIRWDRAPRGGAQFFRAIDPSTNPCLKYISVIIRHWRLEHGICYIILRSSNSVINVLSFLQFRLVKETGSKYIFV